MSRDKKKIHLLAAAYGVTEEQIQVMLGNVKDSFYGYGSYGNYADTGSDWLREQYHLECDFPDTGFAVSYCKICECKGTYNFKLGKYTKEETT